MTNEIIVALITGIMSVIGVILTNSASNRRNEQKQQVSQAVTDTKLEELTREVRKHNSFAERLPVVEAHIETINHRLDQLENKERLK